MRIDGDNRASVNVFTRVNGTREIQLASVPVRAGVLRVDAPPYRTDAMIIEIPATSSPVVVRSIAIETVDGAVLSVSPFSSYFSDPGFQEIVQTPQIKAFRILRTRSLVESPVKTVFEGPSPGGRLEIQAPGTTRTDVALVPLSGWSANAPMSERSGQLSLEMGSGAATLRYTPPLFYPATLLAALGLLVSLILLGRPAFASRLLKSGREEGK